jgi:hypothetical protein
MDGQRVELSVGVQVTVTDNRYSTDHYQEVGTITQIERSYEDTVLKVVFEDGSDEWMYPEEVTPLAQQPGGG